MSGPVEALVRRVFGMLLLVWLLLTVLPTGINLVVNHGNLIAPTVWVSRLRLVVRTVTAVAAATVLFESLTSWWSREAFPALARVLQERSRKEIVLGFVLLLVLSVYSVSTTDSLSDVCAQLSSGRRIERTGRIVGVFSSGKTYGLTFSLRGASDVYSAEFSRDGQDKWRPRPGDMARFSLKETALGSLLIGMSPMPQPSGAPRSATRGWQVGKEPIFRVAH
jgi:hypothetical protein